MLKFFIGSLTSSSKQCFIVQSIADPDPTQMAEAFNLFAPDIYFQSTVKTHIIVRFSGGTWPKKLGESVNYYRILPSKH